jgi:hypothetical protein
MKLKERLGRFLLGKDVYRSNTGIGLFHVYTLMLYIVNLYFYVCMCAQGKVVGNAITIAVTTMLVFFL